MAKFKVVFEHTIVESYEVTVEAESAKEARELVDECPFEHVEENQEPFDIQGLDMSIIEVKKVKEPEE